MYVGRMTAAWDVASVVLAGMHNWQASGVKWPVGPEQFHPIKASAIRSEVLEGVQRAALARITQGMPKQVVPASQVRVVPKPPRRTEEPQ